MENDIETLAVALYVKIDDMLKKWPDLAPARPVTSTPLTLSDAELLTMAVMSALLGFTSERRWLRHVRKNLAGMFPARIGQSGYNKRIRKAFWLFIRVIRMLAVDTTLWSDDVWVVDSTPVECGRSRETVRRSDVAGWAEYGLLRVAFAVLLGAAAAPGVHPVRAAGPVRDRRREGRRAPGPAGHARRRPRRRGRPPAADPDR